MADAFICAAVRTAGGRRNGRLSTIHPADLGGMVIDAVVDRAGIVGDDVDDVVFGCVSQLGPQTFNLARTSILSSSLPESVPGVTIDRQCGSSLQALHFAAQAVMSGTQDVVIAGGVESMSQVPILSAMTVAMDAGMPGPFSGRMMSTRYPGESFDQFVGADRVGRKYGVHHHQLVDFAVASHERAADATATGKFADELLPVEISGPDGATDVHLVDEGIRPDPDRDKISGLEPLVPGGLVNAAMASQICDGASAVLVAGADAVRRLGLQPLARVHGMAVAGSDPTMVLEGPIPATRKLLQSTGVTMSDIAVYEVNEAFGTVPLAWANALDADLERLNVNGGAQALGHPLGATGTKLVTTAVHELRRRGGGLGLISICEGLGTANSTLIEVL